ncbi:MAG: PRC-barrel domain-containing protein [Candidatus Rokubacteria bacterium]|nr:PRC-barrel domain-containing protein [Candidatus Rokubacteria bacterium]
MKTYVAGAVIALLPTLVLAAPGLAQQPRQDRETPSAQRPATDATQPATRGDRGERRDDQRQAWQNREGAIESNRLIGMKIVNAEGKNIGEINQLMVDPKSGKVSHAIIGMGGLLGVAEDKVVVPWTDVTVSAGRDKDRMTARIEQSVLDRAPKYDRSVARGDRDRERAPAASPATQPREDSPKRDSGSPKTEEKSKY